MADYDKTKERILHEAAISELVRMNNHLDSDPDRIESLSYFEVLQELRELESPRTFIPDSLLSWKGITSVNSFSRPINPLDRTSLSIVIPVHNEARRIGSSLESILLYLKDGSRRSEVIVVDDGSVDETLKAVLEQKSSFSYEGIDLRVLRNPGKRGKGYSIRHGMLAATEEIVLFCDADLSTPISEADRLIAPIISGDCDIAFGSRALIPEKIKVRQPRIRELVGDVYGMAVRVLTRLPFKDTQCGFKAFRRSAVPPIFTRQRVEGFAFEAEILLIARNLGFWLREVPVDWRYVHGTDFDLFDESRSFVDLLTIGLNDVIGRYSWRCSASATNLASDAKAHL